MEQKTKRDCYFEITNAIIADLENGVRPWVKPWDGGDAIPARHSQKQHGLTLR